jgi:GlcNAc-PI de-N-acetylase
MVLRFESSVSVIGAAPVASLTANTVRLRTKSVRLRSACNISESARQYARKVIFGQIRKDMTMHKTALNSLVSRACGQLSIAILLVLLSASASAMTQHPRIPCSPGVTPCIDMYVVAHQDDDLLFMNPDIQNSILSGNRVVTVFVTTGCLECDGSLDPDVVYWTGREKGAINAYTFMANPSQASTSADVLPAGWTYSPLAVAGVKVAAYHYNNSANITLIFLRIPDFASGDEAVKLLWNSAVPSVTLFSCQNLCPYGVRPLPVITYTRQLLLDVLAGLISRYHANSISTTDGTNLYQTDFSTPGDGDGPENPSHFFCGLFATSAIAQAEGTGSGPARVLRLYRGYTISNEPENLSDEEAFPKLLTFARYALYDPDVSANPDSTLDAPDFIFSGYETEWPHRKYATRQIQNTGVLTGD